MDVCAVCSVLLAVDRAGEGQVVSLRVWLSWPAVSGAGACVWVFVLWTQQLACDSELGPC